jgi:hypothetical protein
VDLNKLCEAQLSQSTSTRAWLDAAGGLVAGRAARPAASLSLQLHLNPSRARALAELCFGLRFHLVDLNKLCEAQLSQSTSTRAWLDAAGGLVAGRAARAAQTAQYHASAHRPPRLRQSQITGNSNSDRIGNP